MQQQHPPIRLTNRGVGNREMRGTCSRRRCGRLVEAGAREGRGLIEAEQQRRGGGPAGGGQAGPSAGDAERKGPAMLTGPARKDLPSGGVDPPSKARTLAAVGGRSGVAKETTVGAWGLRSGRRSPTRWTGRRPGRRRRGGGRGEGGGGGAWAAAAQWVRAAAAAAVDRGRGNWRGGEGRGDRAKGEREGGIGHNTNGAPPLGAP